MTKMSTLRKIEGRAEPDQGGRRDRAIELTMDSSDHGPSVG